MAEEWTKKLENADGSKGPHWTFDEVKNLMQSRGVQGDPLTIWVGMTGGASASGLTADNMMRLQMIMFASPIVLMVIGALIYRAKVTLTEQEHARIVEELEEKWESMNK